MYTTIGSSLLKQGDCLELLKDLPDGCIDMMFADLPYGVTANKWDTVIPFEPLWEQLLRVGKKNCAFVFTATQPFATALICSQPKLFRYDVIWQKGKTTGFMNARRMPLRAHEHVLIFYASLPVYNPQKTTAGTPNYGTKKPTAVGSNYREYQNAPTEDDGTRYPTSVFKLPAVRGQDIVHPTQKPVALLEWLVKTYSNEGDIVLDPTMGSGTTGVACANTGRGFVGFEKDPTYFATCCKRIQETL